MSKRVLIIGTGPGGLAAAMLLARSGLQVTVLEQSSRVGGRTSTVRNDGFSFDLGPTFFLYPRVLAEIFQAVGRDLRQEVSLVRLDPQYRLVFRLALLRSRLRCGAPVGNLPQSGRCRPRPAVARLPLQAWHRALAETASTLTCWPVRSKGWQLSAVFLKATLLGPSVSSGQSPGSCPFSSSSATGGLAPVGFPSNSYPDRGREWRITRGGKSPKLTIGTRKRLAGAA